VDSGQKEGMERKLTLEELKPFLPAWLWELKKRMKEERERRAKDDA
jgi:hypothetical protein